MTNSKEILADFQFIASRISQFSLETKDIDIRGTRAQVSFDFDYNILGYEEREEHYTGVLQFVAHVKAKVKNSILFKINLKMDGIFVGNLKKLTHEKFKEMLELNGVATLSQLCRAYILSVSALSGINPPIKMPMINIFTLKAKKEFKQKRQDSLSNSKMKVQTEGQ